MNIHFNSDRLDMHVAASMYIAAMQIPGIHITGIEDADAIINIDSIHTVGLKRGKITVYYELDDVQMKGKNTQWYDVDLLYNVSPHMVKYYPPKTKSLPVAMEPTIHYRWPEFAQVYDLVFMGQEREIPEYAYRRQVIPELAKEFRMLRGQCQPQDYCKMLSQAKLKVNVMPQIDGEPLIITRFYESMGVGCLLNDYHEEMDEIAKEGEHYVGFFSLAEAIAKARFYLQRDDLREKIANQAREHVLAHHTWAHRLKTILQDIDNLVR